MIGRRAGRDRSGCRNLTHPGPLVSMESTQGSPRQNLLRNAALLTRQSHTLGASPAQVRLPDHPKCSLSSSSVAKRSGLLEGPGPSGLTHNTLPPPAINSGPAPPQPILLSPGLAPDPVSTGQCLGRRSPPLRRFQRKLGFPTSYWSNSQAQGS